MAIAFVTGGTGLLGTHLILALHAQGYKVRALYRKAIPEVVRDKANWIQGDILDVVALAEAVAGADVVFHVAGLVSFLKRDKAALHKINVEGTANVVNACLDAGIHRLVHCSSVAALGRLRKNARIDESMQWTEETSNSEYGKTKYLAELEVFRGAGEGLSVAMVNPTIVIGEHGDWNKGSMKIFQSIYQGFPWYSMGQTGFVDANDVARAMILLAEATEVQDRFIVSAEDISYRDFFFMVADGFGANRPSKEVTPFYAGLAWRLEWLKSKISGKDPLVTKETAATGLATVSFNNNKLLDTFPGFEYTRLRESVHRICSYLKASHQ